MEIGDLELMGETGGLMLWLIWGFLGLVRVLWVEWAAVGEDGM